MTSEASPLEYFPIFLRLRHHGVLVVGGGEVAARKVRLLLRAGARVQVVARQLNAELARLAADGRLQHTAAEFDAAQVAGCRLVVAATDDAGINGAVAAAAEAAAIPVNVVDDAARSSFITPSLVDRAPLLVAISTAGAAPVLARRLREHLEAWLPAAYGRVATFMGGLRDRVRTGVAGPQRRRVWERFLDGSGPERLLAGDPAGAQAAFEQAIAGDTAGGEVYLVGAGPGDPDLLTLRALRLMQQADVVVYDRLVSPQILDLVRRDAERIDAGKAPRRHEKSQDEINRLLARLAREGKRVLRLKGGDPFIFGRGGEEIELLGAEGIAFQVVPGITAASGCAAYAGIPLTHRDYAQAAIFVTGHARQDGALALNWPQLTAPNQTVVFYMARNTLEEICAHLVAHGLPPDWPAALVEAGTLDRQRVVTGVLSDLADKVRAAGVDGASLLIVGQVVRLRERLRWFPGSSSM